MNEIFYALICINNHVLSCLISMLSKMHKKRGEEYASPLPFAHTRVHRRGGEMRNREREGKEGRKGERECACVCMCVLLMIVFIVFLIFCFE